MASFFYKGREIKGVAFDMDGTLVECEPSNRAAVQNALGKAFQVDLEKYKGMDAADILADIKQQYEDKNVSIKTDDFIAACKAGPEQANAIIENTIREAVSQKFKINWAVHAGVKEVDILADMKTLHGAHNLNIAADDFVAACKAGYKQSIKTLEARRGMIELLQTLKELGVPIIVVTNSDTEMAKEKLTQCGMMDDMYDIIGSDTIAELGLKAKPAPDGYIKAAELLGIDTSEMMGFEDSTAGLTALLSTDALAVHIGDHGTAMNTSAHIRVDGTWIAEDDELDGVDFTDLRALNSQIRRENYKQLLGIKEESPQAAALAPC